jgi:hypothetical protein
MPIICRLLGIEAQAAADLARDRSTLLQHVATCDRQVDVSWFWHGIDYLLGQAEAPAAVHCLRAGGTALPAVADLPSSRLHTPKELKVIAHAVLEVAPEALLSGYDPATMDAAHVYPERWAKLDEAHDTLGDLLEHYASMQHFVDQGAAEGRALLVLYERREDEAGF